MKPSSMMTKYSSAGGPFRYAKDAMFIPRFR